MITNSQLPAYRISHAALGKLLASVVEMELQEKIEPEQFYDTVLAVYNRVLDPDYVPPYYSEHNQEVYDELCARIEKSARRSAIAREAARRRREHREAEKRSLGYAEAAADSPTPEHLETPEQPATDGQNSIPVYPAGSETSPAVASRSDTAPLPVAQQIPAHVWSDTSREGFFIL